MELADTSVWARRRHPRIRSWFEAMVDAGEIAVCDLVVLEVLAGTSRSAYQQLANDFRYFPWIRMGQDDWRRALEVQEQLAASTPQGHRMVRVTDLAIAAAAERVGVTLVHYDRDFDTIGRVTQQVTRWCARRGTLR